MGATIAVFALLVGMVSFALSQSLTDIATSLDTAKIIIAADGIQELYEFIMPIGLSLCVLYFLLDLMEEATHDNFTPEHFVKGMLKMCLGVMLITNLMDLVLIFLDLSNAVSLKFSSIFHVGYNQASLTVPEFTAKSFLTAVGDFASYIVNSIPMLIVLISVYFTSISRNINLAILTIFSPIGVANVFSRGLDSSGMIYLRKFLALCLQGAIIAGIVAIYTIMINDTSWFSMSAVAGVDENASSVITELLIGIAVSALVFKSKSISNEILGVR